MSTKKTMIFTWPTMLQSFDICALNLPGCEGLYLTNSDMLLNLVRNRDPKVHYWYWSVENILSYNPFYMPVRMCF